MGSRVKVNPASTLWRADSIVPLKLSFSGIEIYTPGIAANVRTRAIIA